MAVRPTEQEVAHFLSEFRALIGEGDDANFDLWLNTKNQGFLDETGFTKADVALAICALLPRHYSWGPRPDNSEHRPPGDVWMFWSEFEGYELYIKLKIERGEGKSAVPAVCMSCHEAERTIDRPYWPTRGR